MSAKLRPLLDSFLTDETGQDLAEYGLLLALIAVVVAVAIVALRDEIVNTFDDATQVMAES